MPSPTIGLSVRPHRDFLAHLRGLTPEHRLAEFRAGLLSAHQRALWASTYPDEVPVVNDEYEWLALGLVDLE